MSDGEEWKGEEEAQHIGWSIPMFFGKPETAEERAARAQLEKRLRELEKS